MPPLHLQNKIQLASKVQARHKYKVIRLQIQPKPFRFPTHRKVSLKADPTETPESEDAITEPVTEDAGPESVPLKSAASTTDAAPAKKYNAFISTLDTESHEALVAKHGDIRDISFAVKDNIATKNFPTTCGSEILQNYQSPFEATVVKMIEDKQFGFVLGKTNLDEFGMGSHSINSFFGPVRGIAPLRKHSVGGSSGGSAVAVATGKCGYALGTDTGGSVRLPAAYTGTVGFKPSYGRISRWGVVPYANSLDTVGILGSSVLEVFRALPKAVMAHDPRDPTSQKWQSRKRMYEARRKIRERHSRAWTKFTDPTEEYLQRNFHQLKIGIPLEYNIAELDPVVKEEWKYALGLFQERGCTLVPISLPNTKHALSAYYVIAAAEAASNLAKYDGVRYGTRADCSDGQGDVLYSNTRGQGLGDEVKRRILLGSYSLSSKAIDNYFIKAQKVRRLVQRDFDRVFSLPNLLRDEEQFDLSDMDESVEMENKLGPPQVDFIVCPTAPTLPPTLNRAKKQSSVETYMNDVFTVPSSLAGLPAISLPFKLPGKPGFAGIQMIGQYSDDYRLLLTANAVAKLQEHKGSLLKKHVVSGPKIEKYPSWGLPVTKYPSWGLPVRRMPQEDGELIRKFPTVKGGSRAPRTEKEIAQSVHDSFEDWDSIVGDKW